MQQKSDEILMAEVKTGTPQALGKLYERYKEQLYTYFLRSCGDRAASNDLLMNTFERMYKYRKGYNEYAPFRPWCFQIANNLLKDHHRLKKRYVAMSSIQDNSEKSTYEQKELAYSNYRNLYTALDLLKPLDKRIISQYYLLELSYKDISLIEGISVNNARIRVCRALKKLNELLRKTEL